jgi:glutamyl-tRNA synthetase
MTDSTGNDAILPGNSPQAVRVRFAPSPTGDLHVGGVRTALFNWLYARHMKGTFLLRIEDSDVERSTREFTEVILEGMHWLGLDSDETIVFQSARQSRHAEVMQQLIASGKAYYCDCPADMLDAKREQAIAEGRKPKYDGRCRDRKLGSEGNALRFRSPDEGETSFEDLIRGRVTIDNSELDDLIICRSNGSPTYNFLVVVDDIDMKITHVIRGEDHVTNTPRQMAIYRALDSPIPQFAHLPMVLGPDKSRLSKRHGATSVLEYRKLGYLPDALVNYIARLGWAHGDQEIFRHDELIAHFDIVHVNKSAAVFDQEKLQWVNAQHMKTRSNEELGRLVFPFMREKGYPMDDSYPVQIVAELYRDRTHTLVEMAEAVWYFFRDPAEIDPVGVKKYLRPVMIPHFEALCGIFSGLESFDRAVIQQAFEAYLAKQDMKLGKLAQPLRVAITGQTASPGIFEIIEMIGRDAVIRRTRTAIAMMQQRAASSEE